MVHLARQIMITLGIDYGERKIGLAISSGKLAQPLKVVHSLSEILDIINKEHVEKIVIGISEGQVAKNAKKFAEELKEKTNLEVVEIDETLSTKDAQAMAMEAGIKRKKRKAMEDAYAAALILQSYLDNA